MSSVMPYDSVLPYGQTTSAVPDASSTTEAATQDQLDSLNSQATAMANLGGPGKNAAAAQQWLMQQYASKGMQSTPAGVIPYDQVQPFVAPKKLSAEQIAATKTPVDSTASMIGDSIMGTPVSQAIINNAKNSVASLGALPGEALAAIKNYSKNHEITVPEPYNNTDRAAAKLLGVPEDLTVGQAPIYKMSPDQQQALHDKTLEGMGYDPKKERDQVNKTMEGDLTNANFAGAFLHNDALLGALGNLTSPESANTKRYYRIKAVSHLMDIVASPTIYPPTMVDQAYKQLEDLKNKKESGTLGDLKEMGSSFADNPLKSAAALGAGFITSPELAWTPEMKVGKALYATKLAAATKDAEVASRAAELAGKIKFTPGALPGESEAATLRATELADKAKQSASVVSKIQSKASLVNRAGSVASGAGINTGIAAEQQIDQQGFVAKGSLGAPAVVGGIFGGVLGGGKEKIEKGKPVPYEDVKPINPKEVPPGTGEVPTGTMDYMKDLAGKPAEEIPTPEVGKVTPPEVTPPVEAPSVEGTSVRGDSTAPQKSIIHKLANDNGLDDSAYRAVLQKVAGVDSATALSKKAASAVIKHLKDNKVGLALTAGAAGLGAFENQDQKGGMLGGAVGATFFALAARHPEVLEKAKQMYKEGVPSAEIQKQLGVFQGADRVWRGEFSDKGMSVDISKLSSEKVVPLMDVVGHDKFTQMFPNLSKDLKIQKKVMPANEGGFYNPATKTITINSPLILDSNLSVHGLKNMSTKEVILHEMMHAVQHREGLPNGASYDHFKTQLELEKQELTDKHNQLVRYVKALEKKGGDPQTISKLDKEIQDIRDKVTGEYTPTAIQEAAWEKYFHTSGEHEARAVVDRMHWSEETLKGVPVEKTMGMPMHLQRVGDVFDRKPGEVAASTGKPTDQTETPKFKEWFGNSKMVDKEGKPEQYYTGTSKDKDFTSFKVPRNGVWFNKDPKVASDYAKENDSRNLKYDPDTRTFKDVNSADRVIPAYLKIENPYKITEADHARMNVNNYKAAQGQLFDELRAKGYDGADFDNGTMVALKEPTQIKSSIGNSGEFSPKNKNMTGNANPELVKKLAYAATFGTVGATLGLMYGDKDHPVGSALKGAGLAMLGGPLVKSFISHPIEASKNFGALVKDSVKVVKGESVNDSISKWQASSAKTEVVLARINHAGKELNLSKQERLDIGKVMDGDKTVKLSPAAQKGYNLLRNFDDELGKIGIAHGVLKDLIADHLSHIWKKDDILAKYLDHAGKQVTAGVSPTSAFAKLRSIKSIAEGKAKGLTPLTEDPFEILNTYARSVLGAVRNKALLSDLRRAKTSTGDSLIIPTGKAPSNFVTINHPQMRGISVHPAIASELRQVFYSYELGPAQAALDSLNMAMKRSTVSFSLFHLTSLGDAYLGGMPTFLHPINTMKGMVNSVLGKSEFHKALLAKSDPATQALFERSLESGTKYQIGQSNMVDADVGSGYYEGFKKLQDYLDQVVPHGGLVAKGGIAVSHLADKVIFENGMSGMKFSLWLHTVDQLNRNFADLARRKPDTVIPKQVEIDRMATSHVNNLMGAQDWIGAANQATTRFGKGWLRALGSPIGRRISQYAMFAPDWTTSTAMSFTKALGKGSEQFGKGPLGKVGEGLRGLAQPKTSADLARMYQIRSAALYALIGGTINYAYSGKYLWENKDPMTIDLGNGQRMQWNKHWLEPYEFAVHPGKTIANKMGLLPKEAINQIGHTEYWNPGERSPVMKESRLGHLVKNFRPIPLQNLSEQTPESLFWNIAGRNVRGHRNLSPQEKLQDLMERKEKIKKDRERKLQAQQKRGQ